MSSKSTLSLVERGDLDALRLLARRGQLDPNESWLGANTLLMLAVCHERAEVVELLCGAGGDPTIPASFDAYDLDVRPGDTPRQVARRRGEYYLAQLADAVVRAAGTTPSHQALLEAALGRPLREASVLPCALAALETAGDLETLEILNDPDLAADAIATAQKTGLFGELDRMSRIADLLGAGAPEAQPSPAEAIPGRWQALEGTVTEPEGEDERPLYGDELVDGLAASFTFHPDGTAEGRVGPLPVQLVWGHSPVRIEGCTHSFDAHSGTLSITWLDDDDRAWSVDLEKVD